MLEQCSVLIISTLIDEYKVRFNLIYQEIHAFFKQSESWHAHPRVVDKDTKLK